MNGHGKLLNFSEGLFQRLLVIYPKAHRAEYGPSMNQLFRDQCRDAWNEARNRGLIKLWLRVFPDLLRSSVIEHLAALKEESMNEKIASLFRSRSTAKAAFVTTWAGVFLIVFIASILITFLLPESFCSSARIKIENPTKPFDAVFLQTQFEVLRSDVVLGKVVENLNLREEWGKRYLNVRSMKSAEAIDVLRKRVDFRPVRSTVLIEIRAYSENPQEAARLADGIADAYRQHRSELAVQAAREKGEPLIQGNSAVEVIDRAVASREPVRPNMALNIFLGAILGILLGLVAGCGIGGIAYWLGRKTRIKPA